MKGHTCVFKKQQETDGTVQHPTTAPLLLHILPKSKHLAAVSRSSSEKGFLSSVKIDSFKTSKKELITKKSRKKLKTLQQRETDAAEHSLVHRLQILPNSKTLSAIHQSSKEVLSSTLKGESTSTGEEPLQKKSRKKLKTFMCRLCHVPLKGHKCPLKARKGKRKHEDDLSGDASSYSSSSSSSGLLLLNDAALELEKQDALGLSSSSSSSESDQEPISKRRRLAHAVPDMLTTLSMVADMASSIKVDQAGDEQLDALGCHEIFQHELHQHMLQYLTTVEPDQITEQERLYLQDWSHEFQQRVNQQRPFMSENVVIVQNHDFQNEEIRRNRNLLTSIRTQIRNTKIKNQSISDEIETKKAHAAYITAVSRFLGDIDRLRNK
jgi:hypothetical protein